MAFNINGFISHIDQYNQLARTNLFDVRIPVPRILLGVDTNQSSSLGFGTEQLALVCEAAELPGRSINMIEYRHHAFTERVPHIINYTDIALTFLCTNTFSEKKFFERWMWEMVPSTGDNTGLVRYYRDEAGPVFASDIVIRQYDGVSLSKIVQREGNALEKGIEAIKQLLGDRKEGKPDSYATTPSPIYSVKLIEAIPTSIASMPLNWSDDGFHRLQVNFTFKRIVSLDTKENERDSTTESGGDGLKDLFNNLKNKVTDFIR